jgi:predicted glycosyltransferase/peptidoglycan/xylan/chitin deacetylase (PgdA/CDA1 family)
MKKKVMFYCQHVLGMGHLVRSMALVEGLNQEFDVCFVNGGEIVDGFKPPAGVRLENLSPLKSDEDFVGLEGKDGENLQEIQKARLQQLFRCYEDFRPDLVVIELFPFGRKKFAFELIPLLARIRLEGKSKVVCSLRDILVQKRDQAKHEASVCNTLNRYFDLVVIHADPSFQRLEETFGAMHTINIPIQYTGYVIQGEPEVSEENIPLPSDIPLFLASIGGGRVGVELLESSIDASNLLTARLEHQLLIFTGPYLPEEDFVRLQEKVARHPHIILKRFTANFVKYMGQATVSISMAGYNTCMNILSTGVQALVLPFAGGGNDEQGSRARKLEALGLLGVLGADKLSGEYLAEKIKERLEPQTLRTKLNLQGVTTTTQLLQTLVKIPTPLVTRTNYSSLFETRLTPHLETLQAEGQSCAVFLRDDDGDKDEDTLRQLFDITLSNQVALHVAVIPAGLTPAGLRLLKDMKRAGGDLVELGQHGYQHLNHESEGRKCEFGASRSFAEQFADIAQGKKILEEALLEQFSPIFTPPWNRCTKDTFKALEQLGFKILSKDNSVPMTGYGFREVSITLDLYTWKNGARMKEPETIINEFVKQLSTSQPIGLLLHHKVMDAAAFDFLDALLTELKRYPVIQFHTSQSLILERTGGVLA